MIRFPPSRLLVPLDFSGASLSALEAAKTLARRFGAGLDLVHVQSIPLSLMGFANEENLGTPELLRQMREFARWREDELRRAAAGFPLARVRVGVLNGWPPDEILRSSRARGVGLIVMGTHGHTGVGRVLFGSVAEAVVRRARIPVLAVHEGKRPARFKRILVPCNMRPYAAAALRYAAGFSRKTGAVLTALYAVPEDEETARLRLGRYLAARGLTQARFQAAVGDPRPAILQAAEEGKFDLVVLSAHRKPLLRGFTLGSTAENILRHCHIPVLSVPCAEGN